MAGARKPASSTGSPRKPEPHAGRRLFRLLPALALLLGALSPFAAAPATDEVLVSNIEQTSNPVYIDFAGATHAQGFTTGSSAGGYILSDIKVKTAVTGALTGEQRQSGRAELWSTFASGSNAGKQKEKLASLTVPSSIVTGNVAGQHRQHNRLVAGARRTSSPAPPQSRDVRRPCTDPVAEEPLDIDTFVAQQPVDLLDAVLAEPAHRLGQTLTGCIGGQPRLRPRNNREMNLYHCQTPTSTGGNIVKKFELLRMLNRLRISPKAKYGGAPKKHTPINPGRHDETS